jgi:hypothetical protein
MKAGERINDEAWFNEKWEPEFTGPEWNVRWMASGVPSCPFATNATNLYGPPSVGRCEGPVAAAQTPHWM